MDFLTLDDIDIHGQRVIVREDFNVPIVDNQVQSDLRIKAAIPTIKQCLASGAKVRLLSHLGRPEAPDPKYSLLPVAQRLRQLLGQAVEFSANLVDTQAQITLYENVRFFQGETTNNLDLAKQFASLGDVFVMDAFGSAHRAHASTVGVCEQAKVAVAGPLLVQEVQALNKVMQQPQHPVLAIIGGAKISSKVAVLKALLAQVDFLIIGGGMANTFLAAQGLDIQQSLCEANLLDLAKEILNEHAEKILLPDDYIWFDHKIMDIGTKTLAKFKQYIQQARTIIWNGPLGVFEDPRFAHGTLQIAKDIAQSSAYSVVGGGDTLAAIEQANLTTSFSYVSTGGGAFLEYIEGQKLPAIQALINKRKYDITTH